MTIKCSKI